MDISNLFDEHEDLSVDQCVGNSLCTGYLLKFCDSEFNSENLRFLIAVDSFRDQIFAIEHENHITWKKSWKELDEIYLSISEDEVRNLKQNFVWKSSFPQDSFFKLVDNIWDTFLRYEQ